MIWLHEIDKIIYKLSISNIKIKLEKKKKDNKYKDIIDNKLYSTHIIKYIIIII